VLDARVELGPAFISMGDFDVPTQLSVRASVGYPLRLGPVVLAPGVLVDATPVAYDDGATGTANLLSVLANVPLTYPVTDTVAVRGEVGAGALLFMGLGEGNPFTYNNRGTTGALGAFAWRVGGGVAGGSLRPPLSPRS